MVKGRATDTALFPRSHFVPALRCRHHSRRQHFTSDHSAWRADSGR
jgi:hypothetical protein